MCLAPKLYILPTSITQAFLGKCWLSERIQIKLPHKQSLEDTDCWPRLHLKQGPPHSKIHVTSFFLYLNLKKNTLCFPFLSGRRMVCMFGEWSNKKGRSMPRDERIVENSGNPSLWALGPGLRQSPFTCLLLTAHHWRAKAGRRQSFLRMRRASKFSGACSSYVVKGIHPCLSLASLQQCWVSNSISATEGWDSQGALEGLAW